MAVTYTPNLKLEKPDAGDSSWNDNINTSFDKLDARLTANGASDPGAGAANWQGQLYFQSGDQEFWFSADGIDYSPLMRTGHEWAKGQRASWVPVASGGGGAIPIDLNLGNYFKVDPITENSTVANPLLPAAKHGSDVAMAWMLVIHQGVADYSVAWGADYFWSDGVAPDSPRANEWDYYSFVSISVGGQIKHFGSRGRNMLAAT